MSISCWSSSPYVHLASFTWLILQGILQFSCSSVSMYTIWWENLAVANILKMLDLLLWKFCSLQSCLAWTRWLTLPLCVTALSSSCVKKKFEQHGIFWAFLHLIPDCFGRWAVVRLPCSEAYRSLFSIVCLAYPPSKQQYEHFSQSHGSG